MGVKIMMRRLSLMHWYTGYVEAKDSQEPFATVKM
jgi:hypothetical protein